MKRTITALLLMVMSVAAYAQSWTPAQYTQTKGIIGDSAMRVPRTDTVWKGGTKDSVGAIVYSPTGKTLWVKTDTGWAKVGTGSTDLSAYWDSTAVKSRFVPFTRSIFTTPPITGGNNLTGDLTLGITAADGTTTGGYVTTGDQDFGGIKNFLTRPKRAGFGIYDQGNDPPGSVFNITTTGPQVISELTTNTNGRVTWANTRALTASDLSAWDSTQVKGNVYTQTQSDAKYLQSINSLTSVTQTLATGNAGTDFNIVSTGGTHTFNIPDASGTARGVVNTGNQSFGNGTKTFSAIVALSSMVTTNTGANFYAPNGAGSVTTSLSKYLFGGANALYARLFLAGGNTSTVISPNNNYAGVLIGNSDVVTAGTGTHSYFGNLVVKPVTFTNGGAGVTNSANIIAIGSPTGATRNYTLLTDSGAVALNPTQGNVGIGVTTPTSKLHVGGNATITDTVTVVKTGADTYNPYFRLATGAKGAAFQMGDPTASESTVQLWTTGTGSGPGSGFNERMRVGPIGVSMGTTANLGALTVGTFGLGNTGITSTGNTGGVFNMYTGGYPLSGIGIGIINMGSNTTGSTIVNTAIIKAMAAANWSAGTSYPTYMSFSTTQVGSITAAERMRITDSGNVAINKTTAAAKLDVNGDIAAIHYKGNSGPPTFTPGGSANAILGTGYTLNISGNDAHMYITITTGTGMSTSGTIGTITFNTAYGSTPVSVWSAANINALAAGKIGFNATTATDMTIFSSAVLSPSTDYNFNIITGQ